MKAAGSKSNSSSTGHSTRVQQRSTSERRSSASQASEEGSVETMDQEQESDMQASDSSLTGLLKSNLPPEGREVVDDLLSQSSDYIHKAREYARENPGEALGIAVAAGSVLWALIGTKPGRRVLEAGSAIAMPMLSSWVSRQVGGQLTGKVSQSH